MAEQEASHHAEAGNILTSQDGLIGQTLGGEPAVSVGCRQCHGSVVKVKAGGVLDPSTWPNTGIGRVNPDSSKGSCSACHTRHRFSREQARRPESCGKCHLGSRLSWNLRSPVSARTKDSEKKLASMKDVCTACHAGPFVEGFYVQLDSFVDLYNTKFAVPAKEIRDLLMAEGVITKGNFDDKIDWIYWELWHHEGRRARHGAAMSGPDSAWWHRIYDVAKHFYTELLPEAEAAATKAGKPEVYKKIIDKYILGDVRHEWYVKGFDEKRLQEIRKYYEERYQQKVQ